MPDIIAKVAKLVDALDLGSSAVRCEGSSPSLRTTMPEKASVVQAYATSRAQIKTLLNNKLVLKEYLSCKLI